MLRCARRTACEALGHSLGNLKTKGHAACDALGNLLRFVLMPWPRGDLTQADGLLDGYDAQAVVAHKGSDVDGLVALIEACGAHPAIPPKANRTQQRACSSGPAAAGLRRNLDADQNKIERLFNRLKHYGRVATRYEKLGRNYLSFALWASTLVLLR